MLLTLFSLVLTIAIGGIFIVGLHRVVQWVVTIVEERHAGRTDEQDEQHELASH